MKMNKINTLLCESNLLLRAGIQNHLKDSEYHIISGPDEAPQHKDLSTKHPLDLLIYGAHSGEEFTESLQALKARHQPRSLVILSEDLGGGVMQQSLSVGADGLILKNISAQAFIRYLDLVMMGEKILLTPRLKNHNHDSVLDSRNNFDASSGLERGHKLSQFKLTPREMEIVQCLTSGDPNKLIARKLDITETTVKTHLKAILRKFEVDNRTQAAILAHSAGLIPHMSTHIC
jgi:two-component system nitrate/nitrite response regulator NarL